MRRWLRQYARAVGLLHSYGEAAWPWNVQFVWSLAAEDKAPHALERTHHNWTGCSVSDEVGDWHCSCGALCDHVLPCSRHGRCRSD